MKPVRTEHGWRKKSAIALAASLGLSLAACGPVDLGQSAAQAGTGSPFTGKPYVNQDWAAKATADGGSAIANQPTAVWMDTIGAITAKNGGTTLEGHFQAAASQGAGYIIIVISLRERGRMGEGCSADADARLQSFP